MEDNFEFGTTPSLTENSKVVVYSNGMKATSASTAVVRIGLAEPNRIKSNTLDSVRGFGNPRPRPSFSNPKPAS
jgi:hypothetical protein